MQAEWGGEVEDVPKPSQAAITWNRRDQRKSHGCRESIIFRLKRKDKGEVGKNSCLDLDIVMSPPGADEPRRRVNVLLFLSRDQKRSDPTIGLFPGPFNDMTPWQPFYVWQAGNAGLMHCENDAVTLGRTTKRSGPCNNVIGRLKALNRYGGS